MGDIQVVALLVGKSAYQLRASTGPTSAMPKLVVERSKLTDDERKAVDAGLSALATAYTRELTGLPGSAERMTLEALRAQVAAAERQLATKAAAEKALDDRVKTKAAREAQLEASIAEKLAQDAVDDTAPQPGLRITPPAPVKEDQHV